MPEFYLVVGVLLLLFLVFLLSPFMMHNSVRVSTRSDVNIKLFEQRLAELQAEYQRGDVTVDEFERLKTELQRGLLEEASDDVSSQLVGGKQSMTAMLLVFVLVAVFSTVLYQQTGAKADWEILQTLKDMRQQSSTGERSAQITDQLLEQLNRRLSQRPENPDYLMILANTKMERGKFAAASEAYSQLEQLYPEDSVVLAEYAQALYLASERRLTELAQQLLQRALIINPQQPTALSLLGIANFEQGNYQAAIDYWQQLLPRLGPFSPNRKMIQAGIDEAKALLAKSAGGSETALADTDIEEVKSPVSAAASIQVRVSLAKQMQVDSNAVVFVFARAVGGPRVPLAVARLRVADLPTTVTLDDSMAMAAGLQLSNFPTVELVARISKNGMANPGPGDIEGSVSPVDVASTSTAVPLILNRVLD